jgi:hypothetical protein
MISTVKIVNKNHGNTANRHSIDTDNKVMQLDYHNLANQFPVSTAENAQFSNSLGEISIENHKCMPSQKTINSFVVQRSVQEERFAF